MSKKGQRLREFEKNNRDLSFHDSQKERRERHKAIKERKKLKSVDPQELNSLKSSEKKGKKKNSTIYCDIKLKIANKKVVETRYVHDS